MRGAAAASSIGPGRRSGIDVTLSSDNALVLFSGGQDSTVCLAWALERFARVETVGFDYGQRHRIELDARPSIRERLAENFANVEFNLSDAEMKEIAGLARPGGRIVDWSWSPKWD